MTSPQPRITWMEIRVIRSNYLFVDKHLDAEEVLHESPSALKAFAL
jgi:hypothetical protein